MILWWSVSVSLKEMLQSERAALISDLKELSSEVTDSVLERLEIEHFESLESESEARQMIKDLAENPSTALEKMNARRENRY